jgi:predicted alpha/beta superfamily hydrolase
VAFQLKTIDHFKIPETVPKFIVGHSLGGLMTPLIVLASPKDFFKG